MIWLCWDGENFEGYVEKQGATVEAKEMQVKSSSTGHIAIEVQPSTLSIPNKTWQLRSHQLW